jgi:importin subunit beta-1
LKDPTIYVRDTTAWTLGKICQFHLSSVGQFLLPMVEALHEALFDEPRVASNACLVLRKQQLQKTKEQTKITKKN